MHQESVRLQQELVGCEFSKFGFADFWVRIISHKKLCLSIYWIYKNSKKIRKPEKWPPNGAARPWVLMLNPDRYGGRAGQWAHFSNFKDDLNNSLIFKK